MCGIVGAIAGRNVADILLEGLKRLEYRGYDSAGMSLIAGPDQTVATIKTVGKVARLVSAAKEQGASGKARHRPHPLGHPRQDHPGECAPP